MGVHQNENDYTFYYSPFLQAYFKILVNNEKTIQEPQLIQFIIQNLENSLERFQKCSIIHQTFRKPIQNVTEEDIIYIRKILDNENTKQCFKKKVIDQLKIELNDNYNLKSNETSYLFHLLLSLHMYVQYLQSNENRDDTYIIPVVVKLFDINIIIFENIDNKISIKKSEYYNSNKKLGFIYKRKNYYEPMLYRYYDVREDDIQELFQYGTDTMVDDNIYQIIEYVKGKMKDSNDLLFYKYKERIENDDDKIVNLYINSYSQVTYIITMKGYIIPIEPIMIPDGNYEYIYHFDEFPTYKKAIQYLENFSDYCVISELNKTDDDEITTILFENGTYLPIQKIKESSIDTSSRIVYGHDLYEIECLLYNPENRDDEKDDFINSIKYEDYITKLSFYHIIKILLSVNEEVKGYVKNHTFYKEGETGYFTYIREGKKEYIQKIDEKSHISYGNYSIYGKIINIVKSGDKKGEIRFEVPLIHRIRFILNDKIMIHEHKKDKIYSLINEYISELFIQLDDEEYDKQKMKRYISLCINKDESECRYPCNYYGGCKLYVKERDSNGNIFIEKIKWKLIEKLIIHGIENIMDIVEERVDMNDIRKKITEKEIVYTYSEYRENILDEIFEKKSDFIMKFGDNKEIQRKRHLMKKIDTIPFYIYQLFGDHSNVLFHLDSNNNDLLSIEKALNEVGIWYNIKKLKSILINSVNKESILEHKKIGNEYTIKKLKSMIRGNKYSITSFDLQTIIDEIKYDESLDDNNIGFFIITQKYSIGKNIEKLYFSGEKNDECKILSFHHTYYNNEYILSNIMVDGKYYSTYGELKEKDNKWDKLK
tara:strand:- start:648 stop:3122 length:2475 start_codon:yes stop_codon:yes gene_type:complete